MNDRSEFYEMHYCAGSLLRSRLRAQQMLREARQASWDRTLAEVRALPEVGVTEEEK